MFAVIIIDENVGDTFRGRVGFQNSTHDGNIGMIKYIRASYISYEQCLL